MLVRRYDNGAVDINLSADDTERWANRSGARWPCSTIAGRTVAAGLGPNGDLIDLSINGGRGLDEMAAILNDIQTIDGHELAAILNDVQTGAFK